MIEVHMPNDSIIMHYLDSLVSADAKDKLKSPQTGQCSSDFFVIKMEKDDKTNDLLRKKINVIKKIQAIHLGDAKTAASFFAPFAENYLNLQRAYLVLLQSYKSDISKSKATRSPELLLELADKMILAALLEGAVFRDSHTHRAQLRLLEQLLYDLTSDWSSEDSKFEPFNSELTFEAKIVVPNNHIRGYSELHNKMNIWRFTIVRFWRWLTVQFSRAFAYFQHSIAWIRDLRDNGLGSFFGYFSWIFFIPALIINFGTLIYSLIGTSFIFGSKKLPDIEKEYGWYLRLKIRLKENFYEVINQPMWFVAGLINCFSLAGSLPVIGLYIMVLAQVYDFSVVMLRNFLENRRLDRFKKDLENIKKDKNLSDPGNFIDNFSERIKFDKRNLLFGIFNFMVLLLCIVLMTPAVGSISPYIPLVASFITIILAPLRGLTMDYFRKESAKLNPALIPNNAYGVVVVDEEKFEKGDINLGRYKKGFVVIQGKNNELIKGYKYDENYDKKNGKKLDEVPYDISKLNKNLRLFSRVKTAPKDLSSDLNLNFKADESSWSASAKSIKSFISGS
jgi:hypothetical protein